MSKTKDNIVEIKVDEDIIKFLKYVYFGDLINPVEVASNRAYRDMCRTIRFGNFDKDDRVELKKEVNGFLDTEIKKLVNGSITSEKEFDEWHEQLCKKIVDEYKKSKIQLTYGQAQKWVNMTIKYLYLLEYKEYSVDNIIKWLHIPVDNYIFKAVDDKLNIKKPMDISWSRWDNYDEYLKYQKDIREKIEKDRNIDVPPLLWEFKNWLEVAKGNNNN